jgi:hypothetical protein
MKRFSIVLITLALLSGGTYVVVHAWRKAAKPANNSTTTQSLPSPTDRSEHSTYLVITQWHVRVKLPTDLVGKVTYKMGEGATDQNGNVVQAANILVAVNTSDGNQCAVVIAPIGMVIDSGALLLRSQKDKPFDTTRYRWTFQPNILSDDSYNYHLNFVTPECAGTTNVKQIKELQTAAAKLTTY